MLTKHQEDRIDQLIYRLRFSVLPSDVIGWLKNFKNKKEIDYAIDLLCVFEYISYDELFSRIEYLLCRIVSQIPVTEKIIIIPYGPFAKSSTFITYPLTKTKTYKSLERQKRVILTKGLKFITNVNQYKNIIFIDDFIGSGKSFVKYYTKDKEFIEFNKQTGDWNTFILSVISMEDGIKFIEDSIHNIKIFTERRSKIFDKIKSPLLAFKSINEIETMTLNYGNKINVHQTSPYTWPRGYSESESLISFFYTTPNNTIPIIWGNNNWSPLFPRNHDKRFNSIKKIKNDIRFYNAIYNELKLKLNEGNNLLEYSKNNSVGKYYDYKKHLVLALINLKYKNWDDLHIMQLLSITSEELNSIYSETKKYGFIANGSTQLTNKANNFIKKLYHDSISENFRNETSKNLSIENDLLYLPLSFKGKK